MYYNLLPEEIQKKNLLEYRARLVAVLCGFSALVFLAGAILLLPSFIFLLQKKSILSSELETLVNTQQNSSSKSSTEEFKELENKIKAFALLVGGENEPHDLFNKIIEEKGGDVVIKSYSYSLVGTSTILSIEGIADTRDDLLAFTDRVKAKAPFTEVNFPVELLAKSRDVSFTLSIR